MLPRGPGRSPRQFHPDSESATASLRSRTAAPRLNATHATARSCAFRSTVRRRRPTAQLAGEAVHHVHALLEQLLRGYGYAPYFVSGSDPMKMHQAMAETLDRALDATQPALRLTWQSASGASVTADLTVHVARDADRLRAGLTARARFRSGVYLTAVEATRAS